MSLRNLSHYLLKYSRLIESNECDKIKLNGNSSNILHTPEQSLSGQDEYDKLFPIDSEIRKNALERAWKVRDFEIELYWKRATYFWAFIAATFAGYLAVISSNKYLYGNKLWEFEFYIICLGIVLSSGWHLVNLGSKRWQSNWEGHIDRLEDNFTGPLYRTVTDKISFSVSRINTVVSGAVICIWMLLFLSYLNEYLENNKLVYLPPAHIVFGISFVVVTIILFNTYGKSGLDESEFIYIIRKKR